MLQVATVHFLEQLAKNNNRQWFETQKKEYAAVKTDYEQLVTEVLAGLAEEDSAFKDQTAKECIMRIFRDVRFSKDKSPYKTNLGAGFSKGGRKFPGAGYYLHIEPGGRSFAGGGMWQPEGTQIKALRQEIDYNFKEFGGIVNEKIFKKLFKQIDGDRLVKAPQGYTEDNPAIEYLKLKSFTVGHNIPDTDLTKKGLSKKIKEAFTTMKPFVDFLNNAL
ncbi:MAG: DUF2461 domain-containing protein [Taibaiella sp.]|nr:DUF2461 domain-containing protein [Taibaiella sp.]